jgi:Protein of unknown function (DUF4031)
MILVDSIARYPAKLVAPKARRRSHRWCHLVSDKSFDELHAFAGELGLRRAWFQGDHYDLTEGMRARAIAAGAFAVSARELVKRRVRA